MIVFLDSAVVIYLVERTPNWVVRASTAFAALQPSSIVASPLTRLECLVMPRRNNDLKTEQDFESFFITYFSPFVPLNDAIYDLALTLRAKYVGLKTPDSLLLATAITSGCQVFLTNEPRLLQVTEIRVVRI